MNQRPRNGFSRRSFLGGMLLLPPVIGLSRLAGGTLLEGATATPTAPATATIDFACIATPAQTEGPYFVDEMLNRSDITIDPTDNSVRPGVPLRLEMSIYQINNKACMPLKDAQVDIWHCDALGVYSDVGNAVGKKFLRGYQITDETGKVVFQTVYPGWYQGRTVHIHTKIRLKQSATSYELTSQLYFDDTISDQVYTQAPYSQHANRDTRNNTDGIFNQAATAIKDADDHGENLLVKLTKDEKGGYVGRFNIGLDLNNPQPTVSGPGGGPGFGGPGGGPGPRGTPRPRT